MSPPAARAIPPTSAPATPTFPTCERSTFEISTFGRLPAALRTPCSTPEILTSGSWWCVTVVWWKPAFAFICPFKLPCKPKPPAPVTAPDDEDDDEEDDDQEDEDEVLIPPSPPQFHCNSKFPCRSHLTCTISVVTFVLQPSGTICALPVPFVLRSCFRSILFTRALRCFSICSLLGGLHSPPYPEEECVHQDVE